MSEATLLVLCSRSAHDQNVLVRRAQVRTKPGRSSGEGKRASLEGCEGAGNHPSCSQSPHDNAAVARCAQ
jgi:hypothetical protein